MTTDTPTPRTDKAEVEMINGGCLPGCDSIAHEPLCPYCNGDAVMAEFARQLERELAISTGLVAARDATVARLEKELAESQDKQYGSETKMNMTDTPRTDSLVFGLDARTDASNENTFVQFARQLERELTTATETAERQTLTILTLERELAAANERVAELEAAFNKLGEVANNCRDSAREANDHETAVLS